jgi:hypothetical protein
MYGTAAWTRNRSVSTTLPPDERFLINMELQISV